MKSIENKGRILIMPLCMAFTAPIFMKLRSCSSVVCGDLKKLGKCG
jgi:hypothetical protein